MKTAYFIDTSILTNILEIPNKSQNVYHIKRKLQEYINDQSVVLILPVATIIETGNHIAHIDSGYKRRECANRFITILNKTLDRKAPWFYNANGLSENNLRKMCVEFSNYALTMEMGLGDLSIITEAKEYAAEHQGLINVKIWSADKHLNSFI